MRHRANFVDWLFVAVLVGLVFAPWADGQTWQSCGPCCPPQYSQPRYQPRPNAPEPDGIETRPAPQFQPLPAPPQPTTPPLPPQTAPAEPAKFDWAEYDQRQTKLLEAITANKCQCKPCDCKPTDLTPLIEKLDALIAAQQQQPLPTPPPPTPPPETEQHVVIVADHNAPYWERLARYISDTKKTFSGVQETTLPPFAIGIHPQAVVYRNSVPVRVVKGQYEVENLLSRLARGEPI